MNNVRFLRDAKGGITGFRLTAGRVRSLLFKRTTQQGVGSQFKPGLKYRQCYFTESSLHRDCRTGNLGALTRAMRARAERKNS